MNIFVKVREMTNEVKVIKFNSETEYKNYIETAPDYIKRKATEFEKKYKKIPIILQLIGYDKGMMDQWEPIISWVLVDPSNPEHVVF